MVMVVPRASKHVAGTVVAGRYEVVALIGAGGMGAVYRAIDRHTGLPVALKQTLEERWNEEDERRFEREAQTLRQLDHPAIPRILDHLATEDSRYLVMEFIEGVSLAEVLKQRGAPLGAEEVVRYGFQLCEVLDYLHGREHPIVHRDVKPQNIILRKGSSKVVLVDFGIARGLETEGTKTLIGTLGYAALEQVRGYPEPRSDLYGLGATMYHLLSGEAPAPFNVPPLRSVPPSLAEVIQRATQEAPTRRYESASRMQLALSKVLVDIAPPVVTAPCLLPPEELAAPATRILSPLAFGMVLVCLVLVSLGFILGLASARSSRGQDPVVAAESPPPLPPPPRTPGRPAPSGTGGRTVENPPMMLTEFKPRPATPELAAAAAGWLSSPDSAACVAAQGLEADGWLRCDAGEAAGVWFKPELPELRSISFDVFRAGPPTGFTLRYGEAVQVQCRYNEDSRAYQAMLAVQDGNQLQVSRAIQLPGESFGYSGPYSLELSSDQVVFRAATGQRSLPAQLAGAEQLMIVIHPRPYEQALQLRDLTLR
ncbi:MAG: serine/threonine protein kinase [Armatimonadetes bacterium]|nr:serine/threonine protein kinase [Armatimonadota bacterium]